MMSSIKGHLSEVAGVRINVGAKEYDLYELPYTGVKKYVEIDKHAMKEVGCDMSKYAEKKVEEGLDLKVVEEDGKNTVENSIDELVKKSNGLLEENVKQNCIEVSQIITNLLKDFCSEVVPEKELKVEKRLEEAFRKRMSRFMVGVSGVKVSFSTERNLYLTSHYTPSDLSMLSDFDEFKEELDIVQKSFVTRGRPITRFKDL